MSTKDIWYGYLDAGEKSSPVVRDASIDTSKNKIYLYNHARGEFVEYAQATELEVIYKDLYLLEDFLAEVAQQPELRCTYCYQSRLKEAAAYAAESGYDAFSSSLLYSRYQNHELIRELGQELARHYGIAFLYEDFRTAWQEGIQESKAMGLYRQHYCGCIYSEKDRYHPRSSN